MSDLNKKETANLHAGGGSGGDSSGPEVASGLSFTGLTAMIIGSTIGAGIFTTAGDMAAAGAHTGSVLIGWGICGIGMFCLTMCFFGLNQLRPDLTNGVFSYAREGLGEYAGFNSAWGYWVSAFLCNVSYTVLLFGAIGYFIPIFGGGSNLPAVICASVLLWLLNWLVLRGVQGAAALNILATIGKLIPILVFIIAVLLTRSFSLEIFMDNFWGDGTMPVSDQIKATTTATVWSFIGIEGAVVLSARAKKASDVGKATVTGFFGLFSIYVIVAILCMGILPADEMAQLPTPQMASMLELAVGPWGASLVNLGVVLSLAGALLGWTILAADCAYSVAQQDAFTKGFARSNKYGAPANALFITNGLVQIFLIVTLFSDSAYQLFYSLSSTMIMIPYLLSAFYYAKLVFTQPSPLLSKVFAAVGTIYGVWMLYSAGLDQVLMSTILYAPGILVYIYGRRERGQSLFAGRGEVAAAAAFVGLAMVSLYLIFTGEINPLG